MPTLPHNADPNNDTSSGQFADHKWSFPNPTPSKIDQELFHDEDHIVMPIVRVKHLGMPGKHEQWRIFEDSKAIFNIEGKKLSKKERAFLQTVEGFNFILSQAKAGIRSHNGFKNALKKVLEAPAPIKEVVAPPVQPKRRGRPPKKNKLGT